MSYLASNMADTRNISKLVIKQAGRAKEKVTEKYFTDIAQKILCGCVSVSAVTYWQW